MAHSLVSIIVPTFNRAALLQETLDSILAQSYVFWECVVVDDGSSDATEMVVSGYCKRDARFQFIKRPEHRRKGSAAARNIGFEHSKGDCIYWLDSDDLLEITALETYVSAMSEQCDAVVARVTQTDLMTNEPIKVNTIQSSNLLEDYYSGKVTFYVCGPLWKRSFLEKQSYLFVESLYILIDWDFTMRMLYQHPNLIYLEESLVYYRQHEGSLKTNIIQLNPEKLEAAFGIRKKHLTLIKENKIGNVASFRRHFRDLHLQILRFALEQKNSAMQIKYLKGVIREDFILGDFIHVVRTVFGYFVFKISGRGYRWLR